MTTRRWAILIAAFFIGFLIPELYGYFSGTTTLSQANWEWSDLWWWFALVVTFAVGVLFGHLYVPRKIIVRETRTVALVDEPYDAAFDAKSLKEREELAGASRAEVKGFRFR